MNDDSAAIRAEGETEIARLTAVLLEARAEVVWYEANKERYEQSLAKQWDQRVKDAETARNKVEAELTLARAAVSTDCRDHEKARGKLSLALERADTAEAERNVFEAQSTFLMNVLIRCSHCASGDRYSLHKGELERTPEDLNSGTSLGIRVNSIGSIVREVTKNLPTSAG